MKKISIIGMGLSPEDLTAKHLELIQKADILIAGKRHLSYFEDHPGEKIPITKELSLLTEYIKANMNQKAIVILASGDPLYYGIGHFLTTALDPEYIDIYPNISAVSAAFSRIKESWHDAHIISLHGRDEKDEDLSSVLARKDKIALFTDKIRNPAWVAKKIIEIQESGVGSQKPEEFKICVLEQLGTESEKVAWYTPEQAAEKQFSDPNLVILKRNQESVSSYQLAVSTYQLPVTNSQPPIANSKPPIANRQPPIANSQPPTANIGYPDHLFVHEQGLITKAEIRAITLSKLRLEPGHILWDLGAGSGSVSIEASGFIRHGEIYAVEKNPLRIEHIRQNKENFNIKNLKIIKANLPEKMKELPRPDRIFIGGGGSSLKEILDAACKFLKLKGIIVINTVLLQNIDTALNSLKQSGFKTDIIQVQINRSKDMPWGERLEALNPVWIISAFKP